MEAEDENDENSDEEYDENELAEIMNTQIKHEVRVDGLEEKLQSLSLIKLIEAPKAEFIEVILICLRFQLHQLGFSFDEV